MVRDSELERSLIEAMAKHLPPSASSLRLVDVEGRAGEILGQLRSDIDIILSPGANDEWLVTPESIDSVVAFGCEPSAILLESALEVLRPAGRLIIMNTRSKSSESLVKTLEGGGYTRILVEVGLQGSTPVGVLMRGEKPHTEEHTIDRMKQVASTDTAPRPGRYVHLLIHQTPNKPTWKLTPDEEVKWQAVGVAGNGETVVLAFSSLPKTVEFMQPAVMAGHIKDVNKIAKFRWEVVREWPFPIMLNPSDEIFQSYAVALMTIDPRTAEAPDE